MCYSAPSFTPGTNPLAIEGSDSLVMNSITNAVGFHTGAAVGPPAILPLPRPAGLPEDPVIPHNGFVTVEEGEKAFMHLLRKAGIDASATWDQTMRAIVTDPLYRALNSLAEKKAAWQKVCECTALEYLLEFNFATITVH